MINTGRQTLIAGELAAAKSREALKVALSSMRQSFSFDHVTLFRVSSEQEKTFGPCIHETTLPQSFIRELDRGQLMAVCPVAQRMRGSMLPQVWSLSEIVVADAKPAVAELRDLLSRHDLLGGVVVTYFLADGHRYGLRFEGNRQTLMQNEVNEIALLSLQALDVFGQLHILRESQHSPLSTRELEVVGWTAQGKTSVEIGQILTLSDHTVNAYLTNAIRKLDCVNRTQLVAKALRLRLIA